MFDNVLLESEQEDLLSALIEAERNVRPEQRQEFWVIGLVGRGDVIHHPGLAGGELASHLSDVLTLADAGLVRIVRQGSHDPQFFVVAPFGFRYYDHLKRRAGQPARQVEADVRKYVDSHAFRQRHPGAYKKWLEAEELLWSSDSQRQLTAIGHHCREAMQEFASELVAHYGPPNVEPDRQKIVARFRAVLEQRKPALHKAEGPFLDALLAYWGALSDLVQRQEHGAQREGEPLTWEDGRRIVFQTAVVMFEVNRSLARASQQ